MIVVWLLKYIYLLLRFKTRKKVLIYADDKNTENWMSY